MNLFEMLNAWKLDLQKISRKFVQYEFYEWFDALWNDDINANKLLFVNTLAVFEWFHSWFEIDWNLFQQILIFFHWNCTRPRRIILTMHTKCWNEDRQKLINSLNKWVEHHHKHTSFYIHDKTNRGNETKFEK